MIASPLSFDARAMEKYWAQVPIDYARLIPHYEPFISAGDLVFDAGAEKGAYSFMFRALGARVIAIEPLAAGDAKYVKELVWKYADDPLVTIVPAALSDKIGSTTLRLSHSAGPYLLPSIDQDWLQNSLHAKFYGSNSEDIVVQTVTLDSLIEQFGIPQFIKIDVEGHSAGVLRGLSTPVPALSFELHHDYIRDAWKCVEHMAMIGGYICNFCLGTGGVFEFAEWCDSNTALEYLQNRLTDEGGEAWGDLYMKFKDNA